MGRKMGDSIDMQTRRRSRSRDRRRSRSRDRRRSRSRGRKSRDRRSRSKERRSSEKVKEEGNSVEKRSRSKSVENGENGDGAVKNEAEEHQNGTKEQLSSDEDKNDIEIKKKEDGVQTKRSYRQHKSDSDDENDVAQPPADKRKRPASPRRKSRSRDRRD